MNYRTIIAGLLLIALAVGVGSARLPALRQLPNRQRPRRINALAA